MRFEVDSSLKIYKRQDNSDKIGHITFSSYVAYNLLARGRKVFVLHSA